ncbi:hypothetical protein L6452_03256 [Arctium lappa]|uniref:Uncharacterized protein n=1 Tax=Arctium lappa TaxID=4217 RepID=A0ACB9FLN2_ARCLA|nr:hypothetical protein L6452_03256 [Arctium lappa]
MHAPTQQFLSFRALGAPAVVVSLSLQGIFCIGNCSTVLLFPLLMYYFKLGVTGAAISTVISQWFSSCKNSCSTYDNNSRTSMAARQGPIAMVAHQICGSCVFASSVGLVYGSMKLKYLQDANVDEVVDLAHLALFDN